MLYQQNIPFEGTIRHTQLQHRHYLTLWDATVAVDLISDEAFGSCFTWFLPSMSLTDIEHVLSTTSYSRDTEKRMAMLSTA